MTITRIELEERYDEPNRYDFYKKINAEIAKNFSDSLYEFNESRDEDSIFSITRKGILRQNDYDNIPYGPTTTLAKSGCAIFCIEHGLRVNGKIVLIEQLADEAYQKGYYEPGKGTYHCIFDEYKNGFCKRCNSYKEIYASLRKKHLITLLVDNKKYHNDETMTGSHFINVVGVEGHYMIVDDSYEEFRKVKDAMQILNATRVAWKWL